uniref:Uncharacterized protein n=1 Tax=Onchocerca volvulus TaxID=6282 RepID=A0A8R1XYF5_ONCVO
MLEFFRILIASISCQRRNDPLTRNSRQKHQNVRLNQCQISEKVREKRTNDQEVYQIKNVQNEKRIEENQFGNKQQLDAVCRTVPQLKPPQEKLLRPDKLTTSFAQVASFGTQTTEERKSKKSKTIVSKATQTPPFTTNKETNGKNESEEHLKFQAWKDAKFFVTNQLLAQCLQTPSHEEVLRSVGSYSPIKS